MIALRESEGVLVLAVDCLETSWVLSLRRKER